MKRVKARGLDASDLSGVAGGRTAARDGAAATVLLVGFDAAASDGLRSRLAGDADVLAAPSAEEGLELLSARRVTVLCVGEQLSAAGARRFLDRAREGSAGDLRHDVVLAAGSDLELFQDLVDGERLYYLTPRPPSLADVAAILESALERHRAPVGSRVPVETDWALGARSILELVGRLAMETRLDRAAASIAEEAGRLLRADTADCLIYDPVDETLWRPRVNVGERDGEREDDRDSAAAGLVGFVARTGRAIQLARIGADPRHDPDADNDHGSPDERFLAMPIASGDQALAVVAARRRPSQPPFSESDVHNLELFARHVAPVFGRLALERQLDERSVGSPGVFRRDAVEHHAAGLSDRGQPLQISPGWNRWVFRLLICVFVAAVLFALLGSIHEYASGPALVRLGDRLDITARSTGSVAAVMVEAGQSVSAGQLLARFHSRQEAAELERIDKEFELGLVQRLRDPTDVGISRALSSLRAQKQLAEARLEERSVRAPRAGIVSDVRVHPGQHLLPGEVIVTLAGEGSEPGIFALLPGHYRPLIRPGMALRLELTGYRYSYQHLTVESIGSEVIGPAEARRFLGAGIGDAVPLSGPVVWVRARLPVASFESDGRIYSYHDGIQGTAEVRVRSERLLPALLPGLKGLLGGSHD